MKQTQLIVPMVVALLTTAALAVRGQEQVERSDDFATYAEGSAGAPSWETVTGEWVIQDGTYLQSSYRRSESYSFMKEPLVSNFTFSVRFYAYDQGNGVRAPGLVFRSQSSADHYWVHYDTANGQVCLYVNQAGVGFRELKRLGGVTMAAEEWHTAQVTCEGPRISTSLDGKPILEVEDSTFLAGRVGLRVGQGKIAFDDVRVQGASATLEKEWVVMPESLVLDADDTGVPHLQTAERIVAERGGGYFPVLVKLDDGRLAAAVRGGGRHMFYPEGRLDWIESSDGGKTWSEPRPIVASDGDDRNPAMGQMPDGAIVVAYWEARGDGGPESTMCYVVSRDGGETWSEKRKLFSGPIANPSPFASPFGRITVLRDGTALLCMYGDVDPDYSGPVQLPEGSGGRVSGIVRSRDNGETWEDFSLLSAEAHNEMSLLEMPDGSIIAMMRTADGAVDQTVSNDGGRTWSKPVHVTPASQHPPDIIRLQSGALLMVYGNRIEPFGAGAVLSDDGGRTWRYDKRVMLGWTSHDTDTGYPSVVQLDDGTIVCMYYAISTEELPDERQAIVVRFTEQHLREAAGL